MLIKLDKNNFDNEIKTGLKLVEFYTDWCGYCQKQAHELKEMDKVWIGQVNSEDEAELAIRFGVNSFPTFILFNNGKEVERTSGLRKKESLMELVVKHLK